MNDTHRSKLRRLRLLQHLAFAAPEPRGEHALLGALRADPELSPNIQGIRAALRYLADYDLVSLIEAPGVDWLSAAVTVAGQSWLASPGEHGLDIYSPDDIPRAPADNRRGRASSISTVLPPEGRAWLDQELVRRNFTGITEVTLSLRDKGWRLSRSAVGRHSAALKARIEEQTLKAKEKAEIAKALAGVFGDDVPAIMHGALGTALTAVTDAITGEQYNASKDTLSSLVSALPRLGAGFRQADQHKVEIEARRQALTEAAERIDQAAQERGLSAADAQFWRERVLMGMR